MADVEYYRGLVDPLLADRKWIVLADAAAAATGIVGYLHDIGAPRPFVLSGTPGTGDLPNPDRAEMAILGTRAGTIMQSMRAYFAAVADLPDEVCDRIDTWDPEHEAMALTTGLDPAVEVHGRPAWGGRPAEWIALEDKTTVDALWDDAGVARAPAEVIPANRDALTSAAIRLDAGAGTVWVGDNKEGWHGGGEYARLVTGEESAAEAAAFMEEHCDTARVMPFLEGIPCSVHAVVFPEDVYGFRPCEMLIFRTAGSPLFRYAGLTTWWRPDPADAEEMRRAVVSVARLLRDRVGYRGALGIDGVMTAGGFRPTELNPRHSVGLSLQGMGPDPAIPLSSISRMLIAGEPADYRPAELRALVVENAERYPQMRALTPIDRSVEETSSTPVAIHDGAVAVSPEDEAHGTLRMGPAAMGGVVMFQVEPEHAVVGPSAAPVAASAFRLADELWDAGIGRLITADPLR